MRRLPLYILLITTLASCEKVIDVDLKDSEKQYVIEGIITNRADDCSVRVSRSVSFSSTDGFDGVENANVSIKEEGGNTTTLGAVSKGVYKSGELVVVSGKSYELQVEIGERVFKANCTVPELVPIDSISIREEGFFGEKLKFANVHYKDPAGKGNAYRFVLYVNGRKEPGIFIRNDDYSDGRPSVITLFTPPDDEKNIKSGDLVKVEMQSISSTVYDYWYSLIQGASGNSSSASPANPISNIEGGALGYFSAHQIQSVSGMVQ